MSGPTIRRQFRRPLAEPEPSPTAIPQGPSRIARQLALAHHIEALVESGKVEDYAQAAHLLGLTRARLTQIMNLLLLGPSIQERILTGETAPSERTLRPVSTEPSWEAQARTSTAGQHQPNAGAK